MYSRPIALKFGGKTLSLQKNLSLIALLTNKLSYASSKCKNWVQV